MARRFVGSFEGKFTSGVQQWEHNTPVLQQQGYFSMFSDRQSEDEIALGGEGLNELAKIDISNFSRPLKGGVIALVDVSNPLLGAMGAAAVFAPQKGVNVEQIKVLDNGLRKFAAGCGFPKSTGSGLGLTIARNIVELHRGTIEATSPGRLGGATLVIVMPKLN